MAGGVRLSANVPTCAPFSLPGHAPSRRVFVQRVMSVAWVLLHCIVCQYCNMQSPCLDMSPVQVPSFSMNQCWEH